MRLVHIVIPALVALAGPALAQQAPTDARDGGLRYLSWPGKRDLRPALPTTLAAAPVAPSPIASSASGPAPSARAAAPTARPASQPAQRQGLTPASAWLSPQPQPQAPTAPRPYSELAAPMAAPAPRAAEAVPEPSPSPAPTPADPYAPRRDAPIFRLQRDQPTPRPDQGAPASAPAAPAISGGETSRYYSLHRPVGRRPDSVPIPAPVYLEGLPVDLQETPRSADLAEPPAAPSMVRDGQGRLRPVSAAPDDLP